MQAGKVSIVIPVYNGANYMREAIDSALAQTYADTEVIVVNDGSTDDGETERIARSYGDRIRYLSKENGGVASALNHGIRAMEGEWFAWLSHDDRFAADRLETDMARLATEPGAQITFCSVTEIDAQGAEHAHNTPRLEVVRTPKDAMSLGGVDMCSMSIHRSCLEQVGLFNEQNRTTQDVEMCLRLSVRFPFYLNARGLTYRRDHPARGTHTLIEQLRRDKLACAMFIHDELPITAFFPDFENASGEERSQAWRWMGDMFLGLGASDFADECYRQACGGSTGPRYQLQRLVSRVKTSRHPLVTEVSRLVRDLVGG